MTISDSNVDSKMCCVDYTRMISGTLNEYMTENQILVSPEGTVVVFDGRGRS